MPTFVSSDPLANFSVQCGAALPLVSVITVVLNGGATIEKTIESVLAQRDADFEHIIIDGGSKDETIDIIKKFRSSQMHWISEPDQGIYDAMNKGISLARGEWLIFLGADDAFANENVLRDVFWGQDLGAYDLVCGTSCYQGGRRCVPRIDRRTLIFNTIHHQAAFYRRRNFDHFRYRTDIPVVADYELNFLLYLRRKPVLFFDCQVAVSGDYGVSHSYSHLKAQMAAFKLRGSHINFLLNGAYLGAGLINVVIDRLTRCIGRIKP